MLPKSKQNKYKRRDKKRKTKMKESGRSVIKIARQKSKKR